MLDSGTGAAGGFRHRIAGQPAALAAGHGRLYLAGRFSTVDGHPHPNVAAFTTTASIDALTSRIDIEIAPFQAIVERLDTIPGVSARVAQVIVAETGADMSRFPTAGHLASWAGMCPGNHESAGKHHGGTTRKGDPWLRGALGEAAAAAGRSKDTYLQARYRRIASRRGTKRAVVAVGHSILIAT